MDVSQFQLLGILLGVFIGIVMALTGAGGSILAVPILIFGLGLSLLQTVPIALLAVMLAAGMAAFMGLRAGIVRYKAASLLASFGLVMAPLGVWLAHSVNNQVLTLIFSILLMYVAIRMLLQARRLISKETGDCHDVSQPCRVNQHIGKLSWNAPCARAMILSGAVAGFFSGLLGVGGGFVIVPALRKFTDLEMKSIVATSLAAITLVSAGSVLVYAIKGAIVWHLALPFVIGTMLGMVSGGMLAEQLKNHHMQISFGILAFVIACALLFKTCIQ